MSKSNPYYKELSKKVATWKKIQAKIDSDLKNRQDLTTAESYANNKQYKQAILYAQQISKKNPYYKEAIKKIAEWEDAFANMSNNSNNNSYSTPTYTQPDNSALIQQQKKNCIANAESARSVCESNAKLLSDKDGDWISDSSQRKAMFECYYNYTQTIKNNCN